MRTSCDLSALTINSFGRKRKARTALATFYSRLAVISLTRHNPRARAWLRKRPPVDSVRSQRRQPTVPRDKAEPNPGNRGRCITLIHIILHLLFLVRKTCCQLLHVAFGPSNTILTTSKASQSVQSPFYICEEVRRAKFCQNILKCLDK